MSTCFFCYKNYFLTSHFLIHLQLYRFIYPSKCLLEDSQKFKNKVMKIQFHLKQVNPDLLRAVISIAVLKSRNHCFLNQDSFLQKLSFQKNIKWAQHISSIISSAAKKLLSTTLIFLREEQSDGSFCNNAYLSTQVTS